MNDNQYRRSLLLGGLLAAVLGTGLVTSVSAEPARDTVLITTVEQGKKRTLGKTTDRNLGTGGQCTYGANNKFREATGVWPLIPGNAAEWNTSAARNGWTVVTVPEARSVVVFERGIHGASGEYGHVAWVEKVTPVSGGGYTVSIAEMNGTAGEWKWNKRTVDHGSGMSYILAP